MKESFKMKLESAKIKTKAWLKEAKIKAEEFWEDNKEIIIIATPIVSGIISKTIKYAIKQKNLKEERELKENWIYDRSIGKYLELRRKPTPREYVEIQRRRDYGESLITILDDMRLLR